MTEMDRGQARASHHPAPTWARLVTETTSPTLYAPALLLAVAAAAAADSGPSALAWGAVAAVFVGVIPLLVLSVGARRGHWTDKHVPERAQRYVPLALATVSVAIGLAVMAIGNAPRVLQALVLAMLAGIAAVLLVSRCWKISIHVSVAAGAAVVLGIDFGPAGWLVGLVLLAAASCARTALHAHTIAQVLAAIPLGAGAAALVFGLLH